MKIICSLNGIDGVGKTTQSNMLEKKYPDLVEAFYGLENYESFPKKLGKELHSWWFEESTIEEFCDAMYLSLKNRNDEIMKSNRNMIVIDKGIENFEARIKATLRVRGFAQEEIEKNINKSKEKCEFRDIENVKILINKKTMNKDKVQTNSYNKEQIDLYQHYQNEQIMEIIKQQEKFDVNIDYNLGIEKINEEIKRYLIFKIIEMKDNSKIDIRNDFIYRGNSIKYINFDCIVGNDDFRKIYNLLFNIEKLGYVQIYNCKYYVEKYENTEKYKRTLLDRARNNPKINKEIPIKKLSDYKIPMFYKNILIDFINEMQKQIKNLELVLIHGSAGRESMHEQWSDLDIIICLTKYSFNEIRKIAEIVNKYKENVKIGTTIYSRLEVESLNVDAKTLFALYQMQNKQILPVIFNNIKIPVITEEDLMAKNLNVLPEAIHKLKRLLYSDDSIDKESIIKTLNLIMKVVLINNNIFFKSYEEIFYNFANLYNIDQFNIAEHLNKKKEKDFELVEYAREVIELLINS